MKFLAGCSVLSFALALFINIPTSNAMWAKLSDTELVEKSDVIITAELTGQTQVTINKSKFVIGVLGVDEVLKGDKSRAVVLLALPSREGPRSSTDIFFKDGQKGVWFLREQKREGGTGLYLADHPQRFLSIEHSADKLKTLRGTLKNN